MYLPVHIPDGWKMHFPQIRFQRFRHCFDGPQNMLNFLNRWKTTVRGSLSPFFKPSGPENYQKDANFPLGLKFLDVYITLALFGQF